jgi:hypothetical protein
VRRRSSKDFVQIFRSFYKMSLAENDVGTFRHFNSNRFEFHNDSSRLSGTGLLVQNPRDDRARIQEMIRHYVTKGLQLLGLILTGEALLNYFGDEGGLVKYATLGAGLFYIGWLFQPRKDS